MTKVSKNKVRYREAVGKTRHCGNCVMYHNRTCDLVLGSIDPAYVCDRWAAKKGQTK